jgi:thiamine-monophosphate kinase
MSENEFSVIQKYFRPLTMGRDDLRDDCAVLAVPDGYELVVTTDTLNEGVHFPAAADPAVLARKVLRVNLTDLISSGAQPAAYQLALAFPHAPDAAWLSAFSGALLAENEIFGIYCSGGDTTSTQGPLSITINAMGFVPAGRAVRRGGARDGDLAIVTGEIGHGYAAYKQGNIYVPDAPLELTEIIRDYAHAAIDVSDGLLADAGHIAHASGLGLELRAADIPVTGDLLSAVAGGDDYTIVMAVAPDKAESCLQACRDAGMEQVALIGRFYVGDGQVDLLDANGHVIPVTNRGWVHF